MMISLSVLWARENKSIGANMFKMVPFLLVSDSKLRQIINNATSTNIYNETLKSISDKTE